MTKSTHLQRGYWRSLKTKTVLLGGTLRPALRSLRFFSVLTAKDAKAFAKNAPVPSRTTATLAAISLAAAMTMPTATALTPQVSGGASAFQGQDIMGGAAIVFKRPPRANVGSSALVVKRQPRTTRPTEVARNNPRPTRTAAR